MFTVRKHEPGLQRNFSSALLTREARFDRILFCLINMQNSVCIIQKELWKLIQHISRKPSRVYVINGVNWIRRFLWLWVGSKIFTFFLNWEKICGFKFKWLKFYAYQIFLRSANFWFCCSTQFLLKLYNFKCLKIIESIKISENQEIILNKKLK